MDLEQFLSSLRDTADGAELVDFCQQHVLHGTPFVFRGREAEYLPFKKRLCNKLTITHNEVFLVGSGMLGFSPHKGTAFSLESDIDVAIVSDGLFSTIARMTFDFEYLLRGSYVRLRADEWSKYHLFLRYGSIGWFRPDLPPHREPFSNFKDEWFDFFKSISYGNSEVGNYKVTAGVFRDYACLEAYVVESMTKIKLGMKVGVEQ